MIGLQTPRMRREASSECGHVAATGSRSLASGDRLARRTPRAGARPPLLLLWAAACYEARLAVAILDPDADEKRMMWKYPNCDHLKTAGHRRVDWLWYREQLHLYEYPDNVRATIAVVENMSGSNSKEYDEEARFCVMGVPATFFYLTKYTLDTAERDAEGRLPPEVLRKVAMQYSIFENYISIFHPRLIDLANWTVTDAGANKLRGEVLAAYRQFEKEEHEAASQTVAAGPRGAPQRGAREPDIRVYVYDEREVPQIAPLVQGQIYCSRGQWGMDVTLHDFFATSPCRTDDPSEADFFFVPGYAICQLEGNIFTLDEVDQLYISLVNALPYFNKTGGRDHVFAFGSGMAHSVFQSWQSYIPQSIVLTPETELFNDFAWIIEPPFQTWKDIAIPGALDLSEVVSLLGRNKPLAEREHLAAFYGRADVARGPHPWVGGVDTRQEILRLIRAGGRGEFVSGENQSHDTMHGGYGNSRFCFVPRGKSGWSLRFYEALFAGCVPVMISDKWELPFEDFIDVTTFVIKWPSTQIGPQLVSYLRSIPDSVVQAYKDAGEQARCWYFYPPKKVDVRGHLRRHHRVCVEDDGHDAFEGVLRALRLRRRRSKTSSRTFYFRDASGRVQYVDANLRPLN